MAAECAMCCAEDNIRWENISGNARIVNNNNKM